MGTNDEINLEIEDAAPMAAVANGDDEAAELAAADAEIDAEDEPTVEPEAAGKDDEDEGFDDGEEAEDGDEEAEGAEDEDDDEEGGDEALDAAAAPVIELTPEVYGRIRQCLKTQLAVVDGQIARAERVADEDPFFDRWKAVLLAQRDRLRRQIAEAEAKAPQAAESTTEGVAVEDEDEDEVEVEVEEPETLSA